RVPQLLPNQLGMHQDAGAREHFGAGRVVRNLVTRSSEVHGYHWNLDAELERCAYRDLGDDRAIDENSIPVDLRCEEAGQRACRSQRSVEQSVRAEDGPAFDEVRCGGGEGLGQAGDVAVRSDEVFDESRKDVVWNRGRIRIGEDRESALAE